jgi:NHLM bacteriocin system ABC transporter ATP-binding protein
VTVPIAAPPSRPADSMARRWRALGEPRRLAGNEGLELGPRGVAWRVEEGVLEVFAVPVSEEGRGVRIHLFSAEAGQLLFGMEPPVGIVLEVVAVGPAELSRIDRAGLLELGRSPDTAAELGRGVETWIDALVGERLRDLEGGPPRRAATLAAGSEVRLGEPPPVPEEAEDAPPPVTSATPGRGLVWVRHVAGSTRWAGLEALTLGAGSPPVPVPPRGWLETPGTARLSVLGTAALLAGGGLWSALEAFHELFLLWLEAEVAIHATRDRDRLRQRLELDDQALEAATAHLASVLGPTAPGMPSGGGAPGLAPGIAEEEALLAACRRVAAVHGIEVRPPLARDVARRDPLDRIASASGFRRRRVLLRDDWWRRDNGPLLAYRQRPAGEEGEGGTEPVALLPLRPGRYEMVRPAGERIPVDEAVAEELTGEAEMFYPPLQGERVGFKDLLRVAFRGRSRDFGTLVMVGVAGGLLALVIPLGTARLVGDAIPDADRGQVVQLALGLALAAIAGGVFQITRSIALLRLGGKIDGGLQAALWDRLMSLPVTFFKRYTVGDLAERAMGIDAIREALTGNVLTAVLGAVFSVFSFGLLFYFSWPLALTSLVLVGVLGVATLTLSWIQLRHQRRLLALRGKISSLLFGLIDGISKIRLGSAERRAYARWAGHFTEQRRVTWSARRVANVQAVLSAVYGILTAMVLFAVLVISSETDLAVSEFLAFMAAFGQFQAAVLTLIGVISSLLVLVPVYERLSPILESAPEASEDRTDPGELKGDLEVSHLSFRYREDGPLVLDDVSLTARAGEMIALVGPSGAGKSTVLRLVLGFEEPDSGSIYFDGVDLPSLDLQAVRRQIGVVLQDGRPLSGDIFRNIVGSSRLTIADAWEAAEMAGLADDVRAMPMGMHTLVSEGAGTFSGGQRQRLLIARAVVHKPRILLFDEATSALDNRTQDVVSSSLERLKATRIVVAHRLSTIRKADRIYVFEGGRVVETGSYEELVAAGGVFTRLAERQIA